MLFRRRLQFVKVSKFAELKSISYFNNGMELVLSSLLLTLAAAICIIYTLIAAAKLRQSDFTRQGIPHHRSPFFYLKIGRQAHVVDETNAIYRKYCRSGKPFVGFYLLMQPIVVLLDLDVIRNVLIRDFNSFSHRNLYHNPRDDPLMGNLVVIDNVQWKKLRTKLTPAFTVAKMKFMFPTVVSVGEQLEKVVADLIAVSAVVDIKELTACFTTDVIASITLGFECNSLRNPDAQFRAMIRHLFDSYDMSKDMLQQVFPNVARFLGCVNTPPELTKYFMGMVRDAFEQRQREKIVRPDFLQLMLELYCGKEQQEPWTFEEIAAQAFIFVVAGFETSATTMHFCLYELSLNPDVQQQLRQEIQGVLRDFDGEFSFDSLKQMTYLEQVVSETLRMHSPAPALKRLAVADYNLPGTKYRIQAGTNVIIPMEAIHYDPEIYENPDKFDPTRFTPEAIKLRHPMTFLPFGDGPRNCIGTRFGYMQTMIGIAFLIRSFRFSLAESTPVPLVYDNTILLRAPVGKLELHVERVD